jgi:hypothetical protein
MKKKLQTEITEFLDKNENSKCMDMTLLERKNLNEDFKIYTHPKNTPMVKRLLGNFFF